MSLDHPISDNAMPRTPKAPETGTGYRLLLPGEVIGRQDEVWTGDAWVNVMGHGLAGHQQRAIKFIRRQREDSGPADKAVRQATKRPKLVKKFTAMGMEFHKNLPDSNNPWWSVTLANTEKFQLKWDQKHGWCWRVWVTDWEEVIDQDACGLKPRDAAIQALMEANRRFRTIAECLFRGQPTPP